VDADRLKRLAEGDQCFKLVSLGGCASSTNVMPGRPSSPVRAREVKRLRVSPSSTFATTTIARREAFAIEALALIVVASMLASCRRA
jgi:hypothetical protein